MVKKDIDTDLDNQTEYESVKEEKIEKIDPNLGKTPLTVYKIEESELILIDPEGNGIRIPLPEKYKNTKPGDIIYL